MVCHKCVTAVSVTGISGILRQSIQGASCQLWMQRLYFCGTTIPTPGPKSEFDSDCRTCDILIVYLTMTAPTICKQQSGMTIGQSEVARPPITRPVETAQYQAQCTFTIREQYVRGLGVKRETPTPTSSQITDTGGHRLHSVHTHAVNCNEHPADVVQYTGLIQFNRLSI